MDKWEKAVRGMRESMETYRRRHRPDYAILARTAWDEEWRDPTHPTYPQIRDLIEALSRDPRFIESGKQELPPIDVEQHIRELRKSEREWADMMRQFGIEYPEE